MKIAWLYLDKKAAAVDALKDYSSMKFIIENHHDTLEEAASKKTSVRSSTITGLPHTANPHAAETRLAATLDEIDVLKERYRQALEFMEWFQPAWDSLTEDEQYVLSEFYSNDEGTRIDAIGNISDHYVIERTSAYKKKNRALERFAILLYGK